MSINRYMVIDFNMFLVIIIISLFFMVRYVYRRMKKYDTKGYLHEYVFVIYLIGLVKYVFLPIIVMDANRLIYLYGNKGRARISDYLKIIPTTGISMLLEEQSYLYIVLEFLLFIPMSYFLSVYLKNCSKQKVFLLICCIAAGKELIQFFISFLTKHVNAVCSEDEFLLNIAGSGVMILCSHMLAQRRLKKNNSY